MPTRHNLQPVRLLRMLSMVWGGDGGVGGTYMVQFSIMTKILELKQNTFLGRRGAYNRKTLGVDLGSGRREWELDCTSGSRCSFILDCLNRDEMFNQL